jgi:hypothetical protein
MPANGINQLYQSAHKKLLKVVRDYYLLKALRSLLYFLSYAGGLLLSFILIDILYDLTVPVRVSFWVIIAGMLIVFLYREIIPGIGCAFWPKERDLYEISRKIGKNDQAVQDALINFLQIYHEKGITVYPPFKNLSLKQLFEKFRHTDFYSIISLRILQNPTRRIIIAGITFLLLFFIFPASVSQAVLKVLRPTRSFEKPLPVTLQNLSGNLTVLKNESVQLKGTYRGVTPHKLWLVVKSQPMTEDSTSLERLEISGMSGKSFVYEINHVKNSFSYWFEARVEMASFLNRSAMSGKGKVIVKERPFIRELQAKLTYPAYTRLPATFLPPNNGEITALKGTRVDLEIETNKKLSGAWLLFQDSARVALSIVENKAWGNFKVEHDARYQVIVQDNDSISNYQPVQYSVFALTDEVPYVEIARPGQDLDLGDELAIPLLINLRDDFGFSSLLLKGRHIHAGSTGDTSEFSLPLPLKVLDQNRAVADFNWDLSPLYLIPDDYLEYFAEVSDNDVITGPKTSRSKSYIIRLPSLVEILEQTDEALSEQLDKTQDIARETKELKEKLDEINREMKREEELSWERKQQLQDQLNKQNKAMEKLDEIQKELEDLTNSLDNQKMLSPETLEKFFELQKMFQDLASPELMEAMNELQKALENTNMEELKKAMEQFTLSMEEFEQKIERTYELLKRVQLEQKMDELNRMAEKLLEEQKEVNKNINEEKLSNPEQKEQLADKEGNLEKNTRFFEEKLEDVEKEFQELLGEIARDLEKAREYMQEQQPAEQMQQMQQQIQQGQVNRAQRSGQELEKKLAMMQSMMQQAQQNMKQMQKQEVLQAMQKVQQDLLRASFQQEQLMERSEQTDVASSQITDIARQQAQMQENTNYIIKEMIDISQKTFFLSPQMSQTMSSLMAEMGNALESLENRRPGRAANSQKKAMSNFNQAILSMQNSMNQLKQSGSASGFEQFMEQLQQMAGQQGQLNQETLSLFQQQGKGRLQPSPEALAQMAAQQEMIRQSLEGLTEQAGTRQDVLGRLGELGEEMEEVIDNLKKQKLDRKVIERQEQILSRMLDAQKSVREKEYSKKRQAERENTSIAKSPPELKQEMLERENKLRKEMLNALKEGYSSEYKEYIKSYYELLSRQQQVNPR